MPIAIWFPGCVERACTAVKQPTSPLRQINRPKLQGIWLVGIMRPDTGGCSDNRKHHRECNVNKISSVPAVDALPRQRTNMIVRVQPSAFLTNCQNKTGFGLFLFCPFALLSFIGPAWRWNIHLYCLLGTPVPTSIRCMHNSTGKVKQFLLFAFCWHPSINGLASLSLCCVCCTRNIHMMDASGKGIDQ